jgi:hypothetical protein
MPRIELRATRETKSDNYNGEIFGGPSGFIARMLKPEYFQGTYDSNSPVTYAITMLMFATMRLEANTHSASNKARSCRTRGTEICPVLCCFVLVAWGRVTPH